MQITRTVGTNTKTFKDKVRTRYSGPIDCLKKIKAEDGWRRGVFRGYGVTVLREAPSFGIYFLSYELLSRLFSQGSDVGTMSILMAGGLSGIASWAFTYPIDVVKSRVQADGARIYRGAIHCAVVSYKNEGWRVFTRGVNSTIIRAFPTNAATFVAVSWTLRMFNGSTPSVSNVTDRIREPVISVEEMALSKVALADIM
jgi:solute carrier family 25 carnitine/acylcarnitine transporter 20/29